MTERHVRSTLRVPSYDSFRLPQLRSLSVLISLVGMRFHVCVGILPHEREYPQSLEIDLRVRRDDAEDGVLDYRRLYELAAQRVAKQPLDYLEDIATSLADGAMALPGVTGVRAAVRKPQVLVGGPLAYAEVIAERGDV